MSDEYLVGDEDGLDGSLCMVRDAISRELYAQLSLRDNVIMQEDITGVAYAVTVALQRHRLLRSTVADPALAHRATNPD